MAGESSKKILKLKGKEFTEITEESMQDIQASGALESSNVSEHTFSAKILMKGGNRCGS